MSTAGLELKLPPLALCAALAAVIASLARWAPGANLPFPGHRLVSVAAVLAGLAIAAAGVVEFRRARTTVNPLSPDRASAVVTSGIYRFTRNPMYLGMALALAGVAAWAVSLPGLLLVPVFCAYMGRFQIAPEERALLAGFGEAYASYMRRVRRWI